MIISSFFDIIGGKLASIFGLVLFIVLLLVIFGTGQYLLLGFVKQASKDLRKRKRDINLTYTLVTIIQYVVFGILILLSIELVFGSYFSTRLIIASTLVSYIPAAAIMWLLSYRFYSWYKSNRNAISLLFLVGSAMIAVNLGVGLVIHSYYIWSKKPIDITTVQSQITFPKITPQSAGIVSAFYLYLFFIPLNLAYLFAWGGCVILLHHYSRMLGNIRYWIIISIPLVIFLVSIYPTFLAIPTGSFTFYDQNLILFRILFRLAGTAGGVFIFCVDFLTIARSIRKVNQTSTVADYMAISAYGVALLAIVVQSPIIHTPYPPFGIISSSFMTLASYLFSLGFYFSAVSVSEDEKLRKSIRKFVMKESNLLDSIGTAQMEQEIQKTGPKIAKRNNKS